MRKIGQAVFSAVHIGLDGSVATAIDSPFRTREQREADREAKREAVLRAAVRMFNERGFFSTTFDEVASSLGVSKPTIYHYLGNKEEVLLECVGRGIDELKEAAVEAAKTSGSGLDRLRAFLLRYVQVNMDDFGRCVIRTPDEGLTTEAAGRFKSLKREVDNALRGMIRDAMADGSMAEGDVKLTAFTIAGALNWPARWYKPGPAEEREALAESMVDLLLAGVVAGANAGAAPSGRGRSRRAAGSTGRSTG